MANIHGTTRTFLSTLSVRRATASLLLGNKVFGISIHALREESDLCAYALGKIAGISIHALREESDRAGSGRSGRARGFLSTLSVRRATRPPLLVFGLL